MISLLIAIIYLAFISLGLPDSLLGSAWPVIYRELEVSVSFSGIIFMIIALGTVVSSLLSDRLTKKLGTPKVTVISVALTSFALLGFSVSHSFPLLCLWAVPYGLGAGSIDAALNNYVALHLAAHHMSWLHCMWGVGASISPFIMSSAITRYHSWNMGYRHVGIIQAVLTLLILFTLPLWKQGEQYRGGKIIPETGKKKEASSSGRSQASSASLSIPEILRIPGAWQTLLCMFCYCALEQTAGLWASSYLVLHRGFSETTAARFASLFYLGITAGRGINGFIAMRLNDRQMVRIGLGTASVSLLLILLPFGNIPALAGMVGIGLGCAPIYPCIIHSTPAHFGEDRSQALIGVEMATAYVGILLMPPFFGVLAKQFSISLYPVYLTVILAAMILLHEGIYKAVDPES